MKSRILTSITAITFVAAFPVPIRLQAQDPSSQGQQQAKAERPRHYELIVIATFGGPQSFVNPNETFGSPNQINSRGTTVGGAALPIPFTPTTNGFVCGGPEGLVPFVDHAFEWQNGVVTDLGALPGADNCSVATSINARGEITGTSENGFIDPLLGITQIRAVLWKDGQIEDLGTFGGNHSAAAAINNRGQVIGFALNAIPDPFSIFAFLLSGVSSGTQTRAFLWQNGNMQDLGTLGGPDAGAFLLNERGQVAGNSYTSPTANAATGIPTVDPFLWEHGKMIDLGTLGGTFGGPTAMNNRGQVIGSSNLPGDQTSDQFLWDRGTLIDLTTQSIGGTFLAANAINDAGQIVGGAAFPDHVFDASLWRNGVLSDLGTLEGDCYSIATAINSKGQVAGVSFSCDFRNQRGFVWENGSMFDLNTLIPDDAGLQVVLPLTINDRGEIAGNGLLPGSGCGDPNVCGRAFVLIPTDSGDATGVAPVSQNSRAAVSQIPTTVTQGGPTSREIMAQIHARIGRRNGIAGLGTSPRK